MNDVIDQFRQAIAAAGLPPPDAIIDDGVIHRFSTNGNPRSKSGWYCLHSDGIPAGSFGCWREGLQSTWCEKSGTAMTDTARDTHRQRIAAMKAQRDAERLAERDTAAKIAKAIWDAAKPIDEAAPHGYAATKGIHSNGARLIQAGYAHRLCLRLSPELTGPLLVIPMRNAAGQLRSLQFITEAGVKRPLTGGEKQGCYFAIGSRKGRMIICEGFATGASLHECTGHAVAVAFDSGNLEAVAVALRTKYPALTIIIAADDDHSTPGNPGLTKGKAAAHAAGGVLAVPVFKELAA